MMPIHDHPHRFGGCELSWPEPRRRILGFATSARPSLHFSAQRSGWRQKPDLRLHKSPSSACHVKDAALDKYVMGIGVFDICKIRFNNVLCPLLSAVKRQNILCTGGTLPPLALTNLMWRMPRAGYVDEHSVKSPENVFTGVVTSNLRCLHSV